VRFEIGIANPERGNAGVASTKKERAAITSVVERYICRWGIWLGLGAGFRKAGVN